MVAASETFVLAVCSQNLDVLTAVSTMRVSNTISNRRLNESMITLSISAT